MINRNNLPGLVHFVDTSHMDRINNIIANGSKEELIELAKEINIHQIVNVNSRRNLQNRIKDKLLSFNIDPNTIVSDND